MKQILLLLLLSPLFIFAQSQEIHGVSLNGPKGFIKTGNLEWSSGNNIIGVQTIKSNDSMLFKEHEYICQEASRTTTFLKMDKFEISGIEYSICLQVGDNDMLIGQVPIYRNGYIFYVFVGSFFKDFEKEEQAFEQLYYMLGYMITRVSIF